MQSRSVLRILVPALCLVGSALALYNTQGDNSPLVGEAENLACRGHCIRLIRMERTPFAQSFVFQTSVELQTTTAIECQRRFLLLGEYHCEIKPVAP